MKAGIWWIAIVVVLSVFMFGCGKDTVKPDNKNPQVSAVVANPNTVAPGGNSTITVTASDPDGDALTYAYSASGGSVTGTGAAGVFTAGATAGTATVTATVNDGRNGTANGQVAITISVPAVVFTASSQEVPDVSGGTCLLFTAIPQENVVLVSVKITDPIANAITYNAGSVTVIAGQPIELQASGECYIKRSGLWRFEFQGNRPGGGPFTSFATITVSANPN